MDGWTESKKERRCWRHCIALHRIRLDNCFFFFCLFCSWWLARTLAGSNSGDVTYDAVSRSLSPFFLRLTASRSSCRAVPHRRWSCPLYYIVSHRIASRRVVYIISYHNLYVIISLYHHYCSLASRKMMLNR